MRRPAWCNYKIPHLIILVPLIYLKMSANSSMGQQVLDNRGLNFDGYFYWISIAALIGFTVLFNVGFTMMLTFLNCKFTLHCLLGHFMW